MIEPVLDKWHELESKKLKQEDYAVQFVTVYFPKHTFTKANTRLKTCHFFILEWCFIGLKIIVTIVTRMVTILKIDKNAKYLYSIRIFIYL